MSSELIKNNLTKPVLSFEVQAPNEQSKATQIAKGFIQGITPYAIGIIPKALDFATNTQFFSSVSILTVPLLLLSSKKELNITASMSLS